MAIAGFSFNKILIERKTYPKDKVNISSNVNINNISETSLGFASGSQKSVKFAFIFTVDYEPDIGRVTLNGEVTYLDSEDKIKAILDGWKKNKQAPKEVMTEVLNTILGKSNVEAIFLTREVNLPPPIPLPRVKENTEKQ